jgi:hypothetical protein
LNIDAIVAFQERGVKSDDGMLRFLQANATPFIDRNTLPNVIADVVRKKRWDATWRNELELERDPREFTDAIIDQQQTKQARFFHIKVHNRHRAKLATNCFVYLEKAVRLPNNDVQQLKTVEFKWAGVTIPGVAIAPGSIREFDALFILLESPTEVLFNTFSVSTEYIPRLPNGVAKYEFSYVVRSDNFPPARGTFRLTLREQYTDTTLV